MHKILFYITVRALSGSNWTLTSEQTYISSQSVQDDALYIRFECSCKECTIQEFLDGKNCLNLLPKNGPQLSLWSTESSQRVPTRADMRYSEYKVILMGKNREIQAIYQSLLLNTMNELKAKHSLQTVKNQLKVLITPHGAQKSLYTRMYTRDVKGHIRDLQTYDELQKYLENNFCSWFNISLIANLRKVLQNYQNDLAVTAFSKQVSQYLIQCCFKQVVCEDHQLPDSTEIVCSVFTDFKEVHERQIREFEHQLRQTIALPECERRVDEESGELIFRVKPENTPQRIQLTENDVNLVFKHHTSLQPALIIPLTLVKVVNARNKISHSSCSCLHNTMQSKIFLSS